ncbi:hypothetical protein AMATHDRAFT_71270 [Amanita thiersii Skay4041]|uniref:DUF6533 domain-containing protein n=1 Tax=Amanita thiersii Skay4041 TaxID=703135 RepID=A0A2A9ND58_9AGAR|nr:hypothetical protein AMATHDRAFT_71270 [Amanita thiersii Skay4041]
MNVTTAEEWDAFVTSLEHRQMTMYFDVASIALLIYDHLLVLGLEIKYVWQPRITPVNILFYITRYAVYVEFTVLVYSDLAPSLSLTTCNDIIAYVGWSYSILTFLAQVILALRAWAVWGKDPRLTYGLPTAFIIIASVCLVFLQMTINSLEFIEPAVPHRIGCYLVNGSKLLSICWITFFIIDTIVFILFAIRAFEAYRCGGCSKLVHVVYKDGIMYYFYLSALNLLNVVVMLTQSPDFLIMLLSPIRVTQVILVARIVLHAREQASQTEFFYSEPFQLVSSHQSTHM